jgi:hypothetical protein
LADWTIDQSVNVVRFGNDVAIFEIVIALGGTCQSRSVLATLTGHDDASDEHE